MTICTVLEIEHPSFNVYMMSKMFDSMKSQHIYMVNKVSKLR